MVVLRIFLLMMMIINHFPVRSNQQINFDEPKEEIIMVFRIDPGKVDCFHQNLVNPKHVSIETDFQVTDGGEMDITFMVKNPRGLIIANDVKQMNGQHQVKIDDPKNGHGEYSFCFDNSFSSASSKTVYFEMFLLDKEGNFLQNFDAFAPNSLADSVAGFERITTKVKNNMNEVEKLQTQLRAVESRDRSIMEHNYERVNFWSIIHTGAILFTFLLQIYTIRSLLTEDSKVGRLLRKGRLND